MICKACKKEHSPMLRCGQAAAIEKAREKYTPAVIEAVNARLIVAGALSISREVPKVAAAAIKRAMVRVPRAGRHGQALRTMSKHGQYRDPDERRNIMRMFTHMRRLARRDGLLE